MCGIAGQLGSIEAVGDSLELLAATMGDALVHRGPDSAGNWVDAEAGIALGHRRLAIIDTSPLGNQPMHSRSGRWVLTYNGEVYNHRELRTALEAKGSSFRGHSDTETLVEAIDTWGIDATLHRTNGMFAFAAWDRETRRLVLARDRLGEKPIYWHNGHGQLVFASELKALRRVPGLALDVDPVAAEDLLRWSFIPHPRTIYRNVFQLAPGHVLTAQLGRSGVYVEEHEWWSLGDIIDTNASHRRPTSVAAAAEELIPLLADAVAIRMESDVPLGSFLSGGIDSSLVAAFAQRALGTTKLSTFTVKMPELGFDESQYAHAVAAHLGTSHTSVELPISEVLATVPRLASVWDEPFADPSMLPSLLLCQAARSQLSVCLAGDGGDELFAGYNRHALGSSLWHRVKWMPRFARNGLAQMLLAPSPTTVDRFGGRAGRLLPQKFRLPNLGDKVQKAAAVMRADDNGLWASLAQIWPTDALPLATDSVPTPPPVRRLDPVEEMMLADTAIVLPDQMLVKVDRASMAASLEVRVPLLDHRLLEWSWRQPLEVKTSGGVGKLVLREVLGGMMPPGITDRPKMGFDPPLAAWLRGPLKEWAGDLVSGSQVVANGWLDGAALATTWSEHQSGTRNYDYRLWAVLMLESWLREHAASQP